MVNLHGVIDKDSNNTRRNIYKATRENYLKVFEIFTDYFFEQSKKNPNAPHNIIYKMEGRNNNFS